MIETRSFPDKNYKAIFVNGKTLRLKIDLKQPILELDYPEFYDVKITGKCEGNCSWCYQDSKGTDSHYDIEGIKDFFGPMTENQRPFQVAIGGGEPTSHPDFIEILELFHSMGIMPNYTTNGMFIMRYYSRAIIEATKKYCGGVAISLHPHLKKYWSKAIWQLRLINVKLNAHVIISDKQSIDSFVNIYDKYENEFDYFVLLPAINIGRANDYKVDHDYLFERLKEFDNVDKIAFGAKFYDNLLRNNWLNLSLYEPEMFSKYLDLKDMKLYKSSFEVEE